MVPPTIVSTNSESCFKTLCFNPVLHVGSMIRPSSSLVVSCLAIQYTQLIVAPAYSVPYLTYFQCCVTHEIASVSIVVYNCLSGIHAHVLPLTSLSLSWYVPFELWLSLWVVNIVTCHTSLSVITKTTHQPLLNYWRMWGYNVWVLHIHTHQVTYQPLRGMRECLDHMYMYLGSIDKLVS